MTIQDGWLRESHALTDCSYAMKTDKKNPPNQKNRVRSMFLRVCLTSTAIGYITEKWRLHGIGREDRTSLWQLGVPISPNPLTRRLPCVLSPHSHSLTVTWAGLLPGVWKLLVCQKGCHTALSPPTHRALCYLYHSSKCSSGGNFGDISPGATPTHRVNWGTLLASEG